MSSIYDNPSLSHLGLHPESNPLTLDSLALLVGNLHEKLLNERQQREELQECLFSLQNSLNKNFKPLIEKLEDDFDILSDEIYGLQSIIKGVNDTVALTQQETDVLFKQFEQQQQISQNFEKSQASLQNSFIQFNTQFETVLSQVEILTHRLEVPKSSSTYTPSQTPQIGLEDYPETPQRKVYVPRSRQETPVTPRTITPGAKNMLSRLLTTSTKQQLNPTLSNIKDNAHDKITHHDRPGVVFYTRTQLYQYKPNIVDTLAKIEHINAKHGENITKMGENDPENDETADNIPEGENNNKKQLHKSTTFINFGLPLYLRRQDNPNQQYWLGTHRDSTEKLEFHTQHQQRSIESHQKHIEMYQNGSKYSKFAGNRVCYDNSDPNWVPSEKWHKTDDDELEFLEWKRDQLLKKRAERGNYGSKYDSSVSRLGEYDGRRKYAQNDSNFGNFREGPRSVGHTLVPPSTEPQYDYWGNLIEHAPDRQEKIEQKMKKSAWTIRMEREEEEHRIKEMRREIADVNNAVEGMNVGRFDMNDDEYEQLKKEKIRQHFNSETNDENMTSLSQKLRKEYLDEIITHVQTALNKITANKVVDFATQISHNLLQNNHSEGSCADEIQLSAIVHVIINRVTKEPSLGKVYADLCAKIWNNPQVQSQNFKTMESNLNVYTPGDDTQYYYGALTKPDVLLSFKRVIVVYSQFLLQNYAKFKEFGQNDENTHKLPESLVSLQIAQPTYITDPRQGRNFCTFLGELYKLNIFPPKAMNKAIELLLSTRDEQDVVVVVDFLSSVLPSFLKRTPQVIEDIKDKFGAHITLLSNAVKTEEIELPNGETMKIEKRTKFLMMDFLDKYKGNKM